MLDVKTYLILAALMVIVTAVRFYFANKSSSQDKEMAARNQDRNQLRLHDLLGGKDADEAVTFVSGSSALSLDRERKRVVVISGNSDLSPISVDDISDVRVFDHSTEYKHSLEMERLHRGVERVSLYRPFGKHSLKEVKAGHEQYQYYTGKPIFGLDIVRRSGSTTSVPFYVATSSLFWTEDQPLRDLRMFADRLKREINSLKAAGQP